VYELDKFEEDHTIYYHGQYKISNLKFDGRKRYKLIFLNNPNVIYDVSGIELYKAYSEQYPIKIVNFTMETLIYI
jgi:hypothetical protein